MNPSPNNCNSETNMAHWSVFSKNENTVFRRTELNFLQGYTILQTGKFLFAPAVF